VDVRETTDFAELTERYSDDWRRIAAASPAATVFQTWEWTAAWWQHQGRGKRLRASIFHENGTVVGFAALFLPSVLSPLRTARFVGDGGSDCLDILAAPGYERAVADAFAAHLRTHNYWDWCDLQQVRPGSVASGLSDLPNTDIWQGETCPYLPLAPTWDDFRKTLGKKLRSNIGYYERSLEKQFTVEGRLTTPETFDTDMDAFFELHQKRWNKRWLPGAFASRQARAFHTDAAHRLMQAGNLRLHTLTLDGTIQAALYCFQKGTRCYYYLGGFEPTLARLSIGTVLTARAIRHAIEQDGATEFDFLRGNEGYKYKWGAIDRYNQRLSITRPGLRSALLEKTGQISLRTEQRFKQWMHERNGGAGPKPEEKSAATQESTKIG
jgi:CelD/BcsL family acetyltransferase involved in cellulose biosynthesis